MRKVPAFDELAAPRRRRRCGNGMGSRVLTTLSAHEGLFGRRARSSLKLNNNCGAALLARRERALDGDDEAIVHADELLARPATLHLVAALSRCAHERVGAAED